MCDLDVIIFIVSVTYSKRGFQLKHLKPENSQIRIVHLLSFFNQSSTITRKVLRSKLPPAAREFSGSGTFALCFERNCDITLSAFSIVGQSVAKCTSCWTPFCQCMCMDDASTASAWAAPHVAKKSRTRNLKDF